MARNPAGARASKRGRPSIPKPKTPKPLGRRSVYDPAFAGQAAVMARLGATDADMAEAFGVAVRTIGLWASMHSDFSASLKAGKDYADDRVERSLYQRAVGYSHDAVKIFANPRTGENAVIDYVEHYPPDTTACIFWLKNRRKAEWRDKQEVEHSGQIDVRDTAADDAKRKLAAVLAAGGRESMG